MKRTAAFPATRKSLQPGDPCERTCIIRGCAIRGWCLWAILLIAAPAFGGIMRDFGPFPESEEVVRVPLKPCVLLRSVHAGTRTIEEYGFPDGVAKTILTLDVDHPSTGDWMVNLTMNLGDKEPTYETTLAGASWFPDILTADLNGDGRPDFVIPYTLYRKDRTRANDEPAPGDNVLFILSGGAGHRFTLVENVKFDEEGMVSLLNDGTVQWVHAVLIDRHDARSKFPDHKMYFYLYRLFTVRGDAFEPADSMDARFPKFVSFYPGAKRENHKETKQLTNEQKKALVERNPLRLPEIKVRVIPPEKPNP